MRIQPALEPMPAPVTAVTAVTADDAVEAQMAHYRAVTAYMAEERARREARRRLAAEEAADDAPLDVTTLRGVLARPAPPQDRVAGLIPAEASTLVSAQRKTGKTTFVLNLARTLLTGEEFLGRFTVAPVTGSVAILNYEVSATTLARWAGEMGIDQDRLILANLRGRGNPLAGDHDRAVLASRLREARTEVIIVDTFGRAFTGADQNDTGRVTPFLTGLDTWVRTDVGASDLVLTTHAGWNGERTRGSSGLEDWPDSIIRLTRDPEDESQRFMSAMGRDVEVDEDRLDYHAPTRRLTLAGVGSRKQVGAERKAAELSVHVIRAVTAEPGISTGQIEAAIKGMEDAPTFRSGDVAKAATWAQSTGRIRIERGGPGRAMRHFLA